MFRLFQIVTIFIVFLGFFHPVLAKAPPEPPYGNVGKRLIRIYQIDHKLRFGDVSTSLEKSLTEIREKTTYLVGESSILLKNAWKKPPTFDATRRYRAYIQKYPLSCEIAATKMILDAMGVRISEDTVYQSIPRFSAALSGSIWGNPDVEFVGYITGSQMLETGYGVHEKPLERYLKRSGFESNSENSTRYESGMTVDFHLSALLDQVESGNHVILWGDYCTEKEYEDGLLSKYNIELIKKLPFGAKNPCERSSNNRKMTWTTQNGNIINTISGEHTFLLLGYIGAIENPTHIIVWDTATGRHIYEKDEWMRKWGLMQNRSLLIYNKK